MEKELAQSISVRFSERDNARLTAVSEKTGLKRAYLVRRATEVYLDGLEATRNFEIPLEDKNVKLNEANSAPTSDLAKVQAAVVAAQARRSQGLPPSPATDEPTGQTYRPKSGIDKYSIRRPRPRGPAPTSPDK